MPGKPKAFNDEYDLARVMAKEIHLKESHLLYIFQMLKEYDIRATAGGFKSPLGAMRKEALRLMRQRAVKSRAASKRASR